MIGRLTGIILTKAAPLLMIDVNGLGYEVFAPMNTFYHLPEEGKQVTLHTHFVVREDAQVLYGFYELRERDLFRALIKVNGVGPKLALAILSGMDANSFIQCVQQNNSASLVSIPGVGKKTAERLVIDMRDKFSAEEQVVDQGDVVNDALSALVALGYKANEAKRIIDKVYKPDLNSEQMIRLALSQMVKG
ncbi:MAG: Holliday junction branch migration protein RuvA [Gammaproteobacteria bacterium]|nr:Holliday junction branch migration protein RuvA [Gammaproteobacteria bacterium]MCH9743723.1 Holliday junction branch migration protein RuvA [Gammaproteobacteria bacterium]